VPEFDWTQSPWPRRLFAAGFALTVNVVLLAVILSGRVTNAPVALQSIQVTFVELQPEPEPEIEPEPEPEIIPEPETPPVEIENTAPPDTSAPQDAIPVQAPVSARAVDEAPDAAPTPGRDIYSVSPGTRSVLSGIQCPGAPDVFASTGICPDDARRSVNLAAAPESASDHFSIDVNALRAEWGLGPSILEGEDTLADPNSRRTLSSSDQMRDTLPPRVPDPAFGD